MSHRRRSLAVRGLSALGLTGLLAGCAAEGKPLDIFQGDGSQSQTINDLQIPVFWIAVVVGVLVMAAVLLIVVKFRAKPDDDDLPAQTHGALGLELGWTLLPAVLLAFVAVGTVVTIFDLAETPEDAIEIDVYGQQWWWGFEYDVDQDGEIDITTATEMVIPAGQDVVVNIKSRDVIHSFWIPALNGKKDAVPGRTHQLNIQADEPGIYRGQCTEFCGLSHSRMQMRVIALPQDEYDAWVENQLQDAATPTDAEAVAGLELFQGQCATCHQINGVDEVEFAAQVSGAAPNLTHLMTRSTFAGGILDLYAEANAGDPDYDLDGIPYNELPEEGTFERNQLEAWLRNPEAEKPMAPDPTQYSQYGRGMPNLNLTEQQIDQLVAYLETLK
ncbi:MAG TPA: cytochrome c oxidase subunit II [Acidimicrobiales bacterium]|nr:cytochrome c oxidase subunit II [Acidimicrobiales bacterium]